MREPKRKRPRDSGSEPGSRKVASSPPAPKHTASSIFASGALGPPPTLAPFPYPHAWLPPGLFDRSALLAVREELAALQRTFKETDLFKVYQTGDLANLDPADPTHAARLPQTLRLRSALYSPAFRAWVRQLTGCTKLTEQTDCSCNVYGAGGHLLCHDDVIGTRCARTGRTLNSSSGSCTATQQHISIAARQRPIDPQTEPRVLACAQRRRLPHWPAACLTLSTSRHRLPPLATACHHCPPLPASAYLHSAPPPQLHSYIIPISYLYLFTSLPIHTSTFTSAPPPQLRLLHHLPLAPARAVGAEARRRARALRAGAAAK